MPARRITDFHCQNSLGEKECEPPYGAAPVPRAVPITTAVSLAHGRRGMARGSARASVQETPYTSARCGGGGAAGFGGARVKGPSAQFYYQLSASGHLTFPHWGRGTLREGQGVCPHVSDGLGERMCAA